MAEEMKCCSECGAKHYARGLCQKHYDAQRNAAKPGYAAEQSRKFRAENPTYTAEYNSKNRDKIREQQRKYVANNLESRRAQYRKYHEKNKEKRNAESAIYRENNREAMREMWRKYAAENPEKHRQHVMTRKAAKLKATPEWANTEFEEFVMSEIYDLAVSRKKATGFDWHVDHIVPLKSKKVCGLHCVANLRVIPSLENHRKGNRTWPDMWKATPKGP